MMMFVATMRAPVVISVVFVVFMPVTVTVTASTAAVWYIRTFFWKFQLFLVSLTTVTMTTANTAYIVIFGVLRFDIHYAVKLIIFVNFFFQGLLLG